jgi:hypothetical protein
MILSLALLAALSLLATTASAEPHGPRRDVPDEILIKLRADLSPAAASD